VDRPPTAIHEVPVEQLARSAQAGCSTSFDELVRRYRPRVRALARQRLASDADAEDATQDILLRLYRKLDTYDPGRPFEPWLMTLASRLVITRLRSGLGRPTELPWAEDPADLAYDGAAHHQATGPHGEANGLETRELAERLWSRVETLLSRNEFEAVRLRYAESLDIKAVARRMKRSSTAVRVMLFRARRKLVEGLDPTAFGRDVGPSGQPAIAMGTAAGAGWVTAETADGTPDGNRRRTGQGAQP
jgi:RNA polymerase sigma-70 factor (ECF subfamily)